jgi:hypothetical protein
MKDELEELTTDASSRKTATDWLMKVISARNPINLHLNTVARDEDGPGAVALSELADEPESGKWANAFSAEDLCGAPALPVINLSPAAAKITADDVCWVPEDRRLKPEPTPEPLSRVLQMGAPAREIQREPEVRQPEPRRSPAASMAEEFYGQTALAADPARTHRSPDEVAIEDISREPAPYVVAPMPTWGSFSETFHASDIVERSITEADISRDWVTQSVEPGEERGKDGVVLPFSFKVLKSRDGALGNGASAAPAQPDPMAARFAEDRLIDAMVSSPGMNEAALAVGVEAPALPEITASAAAITEPAFAAPPENTAIVEEAPLAVAPAEKVADAHVEPEPQAAFEMEPVPASVQEPPQQMEAAESESHVDSPETAAVSAESEIAAVEAVTEAVTEAIPELSSEEEIAADSGEAQPESVFAREGFWKGSVPAEVAASEEASRNIDRTASYPAAAGEDLDGPGKPPEEWVSAWKALLRIGSVLPWVAKSLPGGEPSAASESAGAPGEVRQDVAGLRLVQYEIRTTVQDHTLHLKRMDEQLGRIRESLESKSSNSADLVENVESMSKLVRIVGIGLGGLVLVLILLVAILLAHGR